MRRSRASVSRVLLWVSGLLVCGCGSGGQGPALEPAGNAGAGGGGSAGSGGAGGQPASATGAVPQIGACQVFPGDNPWNRDVSALPVRADSDAFIDAIGRSDSVHPDFGTEWQGAPIGIPFVTVGAGQPQVPVRFTAYGDESDSGPYPVPADAPIEGGPDADGDRHALVVDTDACVLYELYRAFPESDGGWAADSGAVFQLSTNDEHPRTWTSADAAGLPIFPGLVRYDEVVTDGALRHAVRFTPARSRRTEPCGADGR